MGRGGELAESLPRRRRRCVGLEGLARLGARGRTERRRPGGGAAPRTGGSRSGRVAGAAGVALSSGGGPIGGGPGPGGGARVGGGRGGWGGGLGGGGGTQGERSGPWRSGSGASPRQRLLWSASPSGRRGPARPIASPSPGAAGPRSGGRSKPTEPASGAT